MLKHFGREDSNKNLNEFLWLMIALLQNDSLSLRKNISRYKPIFGESSVKLLKFISFILS